MGDRPGHRANTAAHIADRDGHATRRPILCAHILNAAAADEAPRGDGLAGDFEGVTSPSLPRPPVSLSLLFPRALDR